MKIMHPPHTSTIQIMQMPRAYGHNSILRRALGAQEMLERETNNNILRRCEHFSVEWCCITVNPAVLRIWIRAESSWSNYTRQHQLLRRKNTRGSVAKDQKIKKSVFRPRRFYCSCLRVVARTNEFACDWIPPEVPNSLLYMHMFEIKIYVAANNKVLGRCARTPHAAFARDEILTARACQLQTIAEVIFGRLYIMQSWKHEKVACPLRVWKRDYAYCRWSFDLMMLFMRVSFQFTHARMKFLMRYFANVARAKISIQTKHKNRSKVVTKTGVDFLRQQVV